MIQPERRRVVKGWARLRTLTTPIGDSRMQKTIFNLVIICAMILALFSVAVPTGTPKCVLLGVEK